MRHYAAFALALLASCTRPPFVVVTIEDPSHLAGETTEVAIGADREKLTTTEPDSNSFPLTIAVTAETTGERELWIEARADAVVLARGRTRAEFKRKGAPAATVELARPCTNDSDCALEVFCDGTGTCVDTMCAYAEQPCAANFPCVISTCIEEARSCNVTVDHALCPDGSYCDPGAGCVVGPRCLPENNGADCQDGAACNGEEQCINFHCVSGSVPEVDDGDPCTIDGCDDGRIALGEEAVFHFPVPGFDGSACTLPGITPPGVCVSSKGGCVPSECGDGVVFLAGGEVCDDGDANNSDAWSLTPHCDTTCMSWAPTCGDSHVDAGHETCDDGDDRDTLNGCSATCQVNDVCGDGLVQTLYEQCDDQNGDNCDGCRDDCQHGCICTAPGACLGSNWCSAGTCVPCDVASHCGPGCVTCAGETPLCGGVSAGCICDPAPAPRGSCAPGTHCGVGGGCTPCEDAQHCGQECVACAGNTPVCGGVETGCVVDASVDPPSLGCAGQPDFTSCDVVTNPDRTYDICIDGVCVSPGCGDATCNPPAPGFARADLVTGWQLPDTNQRTCYDGYNPMTCIDLPCAADGTPAYCGQDAQYGWDTSHTMDQRFARSELVADEPVVSDDVTGLMWQGCTNGLSGSACTEGGTFTANWDDSLAQCDQLVWGGYADWRLPDYYELLSIVDAAQVNPALDPDLFPGTPANDWTWTSTTDGGMSFYAMAVHFFSGYVGDYNKGSTYNARCVRSGSIGGGTRFSSTEPDPSGHPGELVVTDSSTGLAWQGCVAVLTGADCSAGLATTSNWQNALRHCEGLDWAGLSDWRLPSRGELASITHMGMIAPAIENIFPATPTSQHWSSTTFVSTHSMAWYVSFNDGKINTAGKNTAYHVRCTRGP